MPRATGVGLKWAPQGTKAPVQPTPAYRSRARAATCPATRVTVPAARTTWAHRMPAADGRRNAGPPRVAEPEAEDHGAREGQVGGHAEAAAEDPGQHPVVQQRCTPCAGQPTDDERHEEDAGQQPRRAGQVRRRPGRRARVGRVGGRGVWGSKGATVGMGDRDAAVGSSSGTRSGAGGAGACGAARAVVARGVTSPTRRRAGAMAPLAATSPEVVTQSAATPSPICGIGDGVGAAEEQVLGRDLGVGRVGGHHGDRGQSGPSGPSRRRVDEVVRGRVAGAPPTEPGGRRGAPGVAQRRERPPDGRHRPGPRRRPSSRPPRVRCPRSSSPRRRPPGSRRAPRPGCGRTTGPPGTCRCRRGRRARRRDGVAAAARCGTGGSRVPARPARPRPRRWSPHRPRRGGCGRSPTAPGRRGREGRTGRRWPGRRGVRRGPRRTGPGGRRATRPDGHWPASAGSSGSNRVQAAWTVGKDGQRPLDDRVLRGPCAIRADRTASRRRPWPGRCRARRPTPSYRPGSRLGARGTRRGGHRRRRGGRG